MPETKPAKLLAQLASPVARPLGVAGALSVLAALVWPAQAALVAWLIGSLVAGDTPSPPAGAVALGFLALSLLRAVLDASAQRLAQRAALDLTTSVRRRLIDLAARQQIGAEALSPSELAATVSEKAALLAPWAARFRPAMARSRWVPPIYLALALSQSWLVALILLVAGPLIPLFMALVGMAAEGASRQQMAEVGTLSRLAMDRIAAVADLRLLGAGRRAEADLARAADDLRQRTMAVLRIAFLSSTVLELFSALGVALVAVYVGFALLGEIPFGGWGGGISASSGIFLLMIAPEFFQPLRDLAAAWHDRAAALAVAAEITTAEQTLAREDLILGQGAPGPRPDPQTLSWRGLRIAPAPGASPIEIPDGSILPGEAVALTGSSGAGKSTLLAALAGLRRASEGVISWGEQRLDDDSADAIRAGFAWVAQLPRFPDAPLIEALQMGRDGDVTAALHAAGAAEIVAALPGGLAARLGDLGGGVSGGEARRLALARAYLGNPGIVLADEPTADLDPETAAIVTRGLLALRDRGAALLVATHDPALIAAMDRAIDLTRAEAT